MRRCKRYHKFPSNPCVHNEFGDVVILFDGELTDMRREGGRVERSGVEGRKGERGVGKMDGWRGNEGGKYIRRKRKEWDRREGAEEKIERKGGV